MEEQVLCVYGNYNWVSPPNLSEFNFRININQKKKAKKSHNSSKAGKSKVQSDCMYESIQRRYHSSRGVGTVVCNERGATEANVGSTHLMSRAEGPQPRPVPVAALTLL